MLKLSYVVPALAAMSLGLLVACAPVPTEGAANFATQLPVTRWDHRPEAEDWTRATLAALRSEGAVLLSTMPDDIERYCPAYDAAGPDQRAAFWVGMFSAIAKYESTWNPAASGGGGRYLGLLQISPQTARGVGCDLSEGGLKDGASNLSCAVRIAANRVPAGPDNITGITTDWGPMHDGSKRAEVAAWTSGQSYCKG